ncbi:hypothetical protein [Salegentibacter sp. Hel_I_6]|uniref:hypothetical protein n=1 Tax=Salegentibacter sp. Hel_I_6 TaxID=1250278 RepID=UPI00056971A2|nr:hypothetical protein [Salegentibacter sp. Hel_I_6]
MKVISFYGIILTFLIANTFTVSAQDSYTITNFDELIKQNSNSNRNQQSYSEEEIEILKSLIFDLNPLIIINGTESKKLGEGNPKLVIVKSDNLSQLASNIEEMQNVILLNIKHSLSTTPGLLDLSAIKISSLKYVLIECDFECNTRNIEKILKNTSSVKVLYRTTLEQ